MVKKATLVRLSLLIVEFTSLPLVVLALMYLLSGYQMLTVDVKIIPEPRRIHTDRFLRTLTILLAYLHTLCGAIIVIERRIKIGVLRMAVEVAVIVVLSLLLVFFLALEAVL